MFLKLWNYMRGYVEIKVTGFSVERFITIAAHRGIFIWDVVEKGACVHMKLSVKAFKLLKPCAKKTGSSIKIIKKYGLPFFMHRYRKRKLLFLGIFFFAALLYFLSTFIWMIDVEGSERINNAEIIDFLEDNGLTTGSSKLFFSDKKYEKLILDSFSDISWVDVDLKGTRVRIRIVETIVERIIPNRQTPADIVADSDGLIVTIATSAGTPMVKPGDVVKKGDILVSSEVVIGTVDTGISKRYVHAEADITARMYYTIELSVPFSYYEKKYTGKTITNYSIILFGKEFGLLHKKVGYTEFDKSRSEKTIGFGENYPLPASTAKEVYSEYVEIEYVRTVEQAKELCEMTLSQRIIREFDSEAEIIDKKIIYEEDGDQLKLTALITTVEPLGETRLIQPAN